MLAVMPSTNSDSGEVWTSTVSFRPVGRLAGESAGERQHQIVDLAGDNVVVVDALLG